ncbi:MAG: hypothetical protein EXS55_02695 [Candidatus Magasanikbacteria bacterium]|nr:hypothetical protein [Candidatus Magasanikbacteria bacterium]
MLRHNISGPLFNNLDPGSYLIFYLYPKLRPFTDNRVEAYPADFFKDIYVAAHTDSRVWEEIVARYNLNVIFYSFLDPSSIALPFIVARLTDPAWAPVYADNYAIVFLKRNNQNANLIQQFEIPKEKFSLQQK